MLAFIAAGGFQPGRTGSIGFGFIEHLSVAGQKLYPDVLHRLACCQVLDKGHPASVSLFLDRESHVRDKKNPFGIGLLFPVSDAFELKQHQAGSLSHVLENLGHGQHGEGGCLFVLAGYRDAAGRACDLGIKQIFRFPVVQSFGRKAMV